MKDKEVVAAEVKGLLEVFAEGIFSAEEKAICQHIWLKLSRKKTMDITRTQPNIWAAAVVWSFCRANFKQEDGITLDRLCSFFNTKKSTVTNKAGEICRLLSIDFFKPEFTTGRTQEANPLNDLVLTEDGFIVPRGLLEK